MPPTPPQAVAVEVLATRPTEADNALIARLNESTDRDLAPVTYLVKIRLQTKPPATATGWALYVDDFRIPKYWQYADGIYFRVYDPEFFTDHAGERLRFSSNGTDFVETGLTLVPPDNTPTDARNLPGRSELLG